MASSDEDGEIVPDHVTNYHFVNCKDNPISFSSLPLRWCEDEIPNGSSMQIFLSGSADDGLQKIYKKVIAWKFELSYALPEIYVLTKDNTWIKLQRPRKSFEDTIKTILITVHCFHFMKKNPGASGDAIWNHLSRAFSSYEVKPSENDLLDHMPLINEAAVRDKDIAKSEYLANFLLEMPGKRRASHEQENGTTKKSKFIVDADNENNDDDDDDDDECDGNEDGLFDTVCALCDNGGELLCCEGRCMRSFHPTVDSAVDSICESLGYSAAQVEAIQNFMCKNCEYQRHQCFICGMLGSSNKPSGAEVFPCVSATCGHFYHPKCVVELLHARDDTEAKELKKSIASGESFTCPAHKCYVCKQGEDKKVFDLQFATCRRCPKAYHRKCLPREITFECTNATGIHQRAWDGLLPNRILIYCMDHKIIPELGTPERNHILFLDIDIKKKQHSLVSPSRKEKVVPEKRSTVSGNVRERNALQMQKQVENVYTAVKGGDFTNKTERGFSGQGFEPKTKASTLKSLKDNNMSVAGKIYVSSAADKNKSSLKNDQSNSLLTMRSYPSKEQNDCSGKTENRIALKPVKKMASSTQPLISEMEKRILGLMKNSTSSFNMEEFVTKQKRLSGRAYSSRFAVDKNITMGKVEGSVQAVRTALKKLEEGCAIEDAKAVCEPEILEQMIRWKRKLSVYLAPFLHGMRYTSFGRHFTKVDKLKEIVDRLHWYVQDGDMVVDFCCGSNDFSCLMKEKLDKMGKRCSFINYDIIPPKNKFNFEKRDWMSVRLGELSIGSRLIMGLNPPFGVQASLANKFIDKALMFKPKLLILIVPKEAQRLEEKEPPYDIIWEDDGILSGKSFYLPGSVDKHNQQLEQWNMEPPPLYLWSRPDWTTKHKAIAQKHGHSYKKQKEMHTEGNDVEFVVSNFLMEENHDQYGDFSKILDDVPEDLYDAETKGTSAAVLDKRENGLSIGGGSCDRNKLSFEYLNEMLYGGKNICLNETSQMGKLDSGEPLLNKEEMCVDMELSTPTYSPANNDADHRSFLADKPCEALETPTKMISTVEGFHHSQASFSGHHWEVGTEYNATEGGVQK